MSVGLQRAIGEDLYPISRAAIHTVQCQFEKVFEIVADSLAQAPTSGDRASTLPWKVRFVQRMREGLFKVSPICGMPKVISALRQCMLAIDAETLAQLPTESRRARPLDHPAEEYLSSYYARGQQFWDQVYGPHATKVSDALTAYNPDLAEFGIKDIYGKVLSDMSIINEIETELLLVSALAPQKVPHLLKGHVMGAERVGATPEQIQGVLQLVDELAI
ncbi:hypothetical protein H4R34_004513 [Dimargaris verticillata]|uniref:Carboxymuconolactone decarboxylase-like domain-containing protein n=1 Tax=Dimargaris verticillata TaxID=2761393 RepID=A0A9W8B459_9FUNG|nr:hypothetical protein H4R34_004513 [Dimargaris verticillata]